MEGIIGRISARECMWLYHHGKLQYEAYASTRVIDGNTWHVQFTKGASNVGLHNLMDEHGEICWRGQLVQYVPSNLGRGRGIIWYFICNDCQSRVKNLYFENYFRAPLCRRCCKLPYRQSTRAERKVSFYLRRHPEAAQQVLDSGIVPAYGYRSR